ncbi:hypothetical protein, partial [Bradyrhizobium sp. 137]|uniref:hypothetical protein n=1 Tax=Bradyrhizobium sp. 137 TaxID=2782614 RepID=UPI001FF9896E
RKGRTYDRTVPMCESIEKALATRAVPHMGARSPALKRLGTPGDRHFNPLMPISRTAEAALAKSINCKTWNLAHHSAGVTFSSQI